MKRLSSLFLALFAALATARAVDFQLFEGDGFDTWVEEGIGFGRGPASGLIPGLPDELKGYIGNGFACSGHGGNPATGRLISPEFTVDHRFLHFLVAGGNLQGQTAVQLIVNGQTALEAVGQQDLEFRPVTWDLSPWKGQKARVRIIDEANGPFAWIAADHFAFSEEKLFAFPAAHRKEGGADLVASKTIAGNNIPIGTRLDIFATHEELKVTSPTAIAFDEKGALYVAETNRFRFGIHDDRNNRYWYHDDLAAKTTADRRALHEKWQEKVPLASLTERSEVVRKLVDTDGDGKADKMTVFADKFNDMLDGTAAGVFAYLGKVYFACIPKIHILEDTQGTGVADKRSLVADGFGVHISLSGHDMNGFALGVDGRIYGTIGDRGFNIVTREGVTYKFLDQGAVFRFEPDGSNFEVVHAGLRNPKEIAFDEFGNGVTVDNNSDQGDPSRIVYIMDGVDSGWRMGHQGLFTFRDDIGLPEAPISPWMTEKMANTRNDSQPAYIVPPIGNLTQGPSGLTYHPGNGFLESERGRFLICDYKAAPTSSGIFSFKLVPDGAGLKFKDAYKFNAGVCPTDVEYSYDGRLFVADFIGGWVSADQGRIYTLTAESEKNQGRTPETAALMKEGLEKKTNVELMKLFAHPDQRIRLRAHITLAGRDDSTPLLIAAAREGELMPRLHGVWGLGIRARKNADQEAATTLVTLLGDSEPEVRAQAAHLLGEVPATDAARLIPLLKDKSLRVRAFAALSLGRLKSASALDPLVEMLAENADRDLYLRHAGSMGLLCAATEEQLGALKSHESASVRLAAVIALRRLASPYLADFLSDREPRVIDEAIRAIHEAPVPAARPAMNALLDAYVGEKAGRPLPPMIARRLLHSAFRSGGKENAARLIGVAGGKGLEIKQRLEALRLLLQWPRPYPVDQSLAKWEPLPERDAAEVKPTLEAGIPALLNGEEALLAPTLLLVNRLGLSRENFPQEALLRIVNTAKLPGEARATALDLWFSGKPADADSLLVKLTSDPADQVATTALTLLVKSNPAQALEGATTALKAPGAARRQSAWNIIGSIPGKAADDLILAGLQNLASAKPDEGAQIELLDAAAKRQDAGVVAALAAYQKSLNPADPLAAALPALHGGDPIKGEELFRTHGTAQCLRCHKAGEGGHDTGGDAGPNLMGVFKRNPDRKYLLESLVVPGAKVAAGYGLVSLTLKKGQTVAGVLNEETKDQYVVTVGTDVWSVQKADVQSVTEPISAMPPMSTLLTLREMRDIVAFLATLDKPPKEAVKRPEPRPFAAK
jgi:quinoprotein glucose dehydrogenase